jgi:hypothetical protein
MPRTTSDLVKDILDEEPDKPLVPFIKAANKLVERCCASVEEYTDDDLITIETWLAAHCYCTMSPQTVMEQAGSVQETYQTKVDLGLNNSRYGQLVLRLDWNGGLAALDNAVKDVDLPLPTEVDNRRLGMTWLGTERT